MNKNVLGIIIIIIGILIVLYPIVAKILAEFNQTVAITNYKSIINNTSENEINKSKKEAGEYNNKILEEDSFMVDLSNIDFSNNNEENISYMNVLNIGEIMAYISIPKINVYLPIYHGTSYKVLEAGIGHVENTSLPIGGKGTHAVLTGHTGLARTKMFDDINKLDYGDKFYIYVLDDVLAYEVDDIKVVEPNDTDSIKIYKDKDYVTLVTCTPYMINSHRLLVRGIRTKNEDFSDAEKIEKRAETIWIITVVKIIIIIGLIIFFIKVLKMNLNRKSKNERK